MVEMTANHIVSYMITSASADASAALIKLRVLTREYYYQPPDVSRDDYETLLKGIELINSALHIQSAAPIKVS